MAFKTYDQRTIDSAGAFLLGELERLDRELHMPLASVTWGRDIDLRNDVTIADEVSSFTTTDFGAVGLNNQGKNFVGRNPTEVSGISVATTKQGNPLHTWAMELGYSIVELAAAAQVGRPIDEQKHAGIKLKHQMDTDEMVYIGDKDVGAYGLLNSPKVTVNSASANWATASPEVILDEVNGFLEATWEQSGYSLCPTHLLLPPKKFSLLTKPVSNAGSKSILQFIREECISNANNGNPLEIFPVKWLTGRGVAAKDRMVAYTKDQQYVRFPLVPLQSTPLEHRGLYQLLVYFGALGEVEFVYPETISYADGI